MRSQSLAEVTVPAKVKRTFDEMNDEGLMEDLSILPSQNNAVLYNNERNGEQYFDLVINCEGKFFGVNRCIVLNLSKYLEDLHHDALALGKSGIIEVAYEEGILEKDFIEQAIRFMYTGNYDGNVRDIVPPTNLTDNDLQDTQDEADEADKGEPSKVQTQTQMEDMTSGPRLGNSYVLGLGPDRATLDGRRPTTAVALTPVPIGNKALRFNTGMFLAAHKLQIHALKPEACDKYIAAFRSTIRGQGWDMFADSVELLYRNSSTNSQQKGNPLQSIMVGQALEDHVSFRLSGILTRIKSTSSDFIASLLEEVSELQERTVKERDNALERLADTIAKLEVEQEKQLPRDRCIDCFAGLQDVDESGDGKSPHKIADLEKSLR
ncbi:hypothetical protein VTL71DRAFT_8658 [Oculimacula yallundae]|uniref:BTB domain-containing protein n=1 Tax=Oculimacula yallundae TaxID=86028 RepID=A0ABR4CY93_9HELO